ncbi:HEPACAM family member 2 [Anguilla rostrata]|uniref:HEPACAM family member 2 n=1 Tax=Anguilla rostrata TaxID=7938 RepID=UPI0030D3071E
METFSSTFLPLLWTVTSLLSGTYCSPYVRVPTILHGTYGHSLLLPVEDFVHSEDVEIFFSWNFRGPTEDMPTLLVAFQNQKDINMDKSRFSFQPPNASLLIHSLDQTVEGEYWLAFYITFPNGSTVRENNPVRITVDVPVSVPVIKKSPATEVVEDKENVTWMCSVENGTRVRYRWFQDDRPVRAGARHTLSPDNSSLVISPVRKEDIGEYSCVVENFISEETSAPAALNIFYGPYNLAVKSDQGLQTGGVFTVNPGELVFFDCLADSNPPNSCAWISKTNNATEVLMTGPRFEVLSYKLAHTEEFLCRAFNNVTQKQDETEFTLVVASLGTGKEKHFQEGSAASPLTAIVIVSLIVIICMLVVLFRKSCHPHRVIMNIYNRPLTDQKGPHLSGHEDATEDFGIYEFVAIPGRAESTLASNRSLAGLESAQDLHTTIYDVIKHVPETPSQSLLK